jgi:serine protease Do
MKQRFAPVALFLTWVGILVAYWPSGCAQRMAASHPEVGAVQNPAVVQLPGPSNGARPLLPHPAFAFAQEMSDKNVTIADIAERSTPSVVNVASRRVVKEQGQQDPFFRHFFGPFGGQEPQERQQRGLGSGVIYSSDGLVLTNNHVIEGADEITVTTGDGVDYAAEVAGTDEKSDVAVLRLKGPVKDLVPIVVGDSSKLRVGDVVLAIGNPFGLSQTVTMGIVSAKGRSETGIDVDYADFIQTDAAINPGNSGGALVNMQGELVGINTAIFSRTGGYQGIGFAIPSSMAREIAQSLIEHGKVVRGWLGIGIQDVEPDLATAMGLPNADGVLVNNVESGSPAEKAGLQRDDVVLTVAGKKTNSSTQLRNLIAATGANKKVEIGILRGGKPQTLVVLLGELKTDSPGKTPAVEPHEQTLDGLTLEGLNPKLRQRLSLPASIKQGIVITGVAPGSSAAESGVQPGDLIVEVNRKPVGTVSDFMAAYKQSSPKGALLLLYRDGRTRYVVLSR